MFFRRKRLREERAKRDERFRQYASQQEEFYHGLNEKPKEPKEKKIVSRHQIVSCCEQMLDVSRDLEDAKTEYELVTAYLNDIQMIEELPEDKREQVSEGATSIVTLSRTKQDFFRRDRVITDSQFAQMQQEEDGIDGVLKRFERNEAYLDTVNRDLHYLEGEKMEWDIVHQECVREQKLLRRASIVLLIVSVAAVVGILVASPILRLDMRLELLAVLFVAALLGAYILFRFQDCSREIHRCEVNRNYAVTLENRAKIKYVNVKNAVDYTCEKYHVKNSKELVYLYEKYQDVVREQDQLRQMNEDMTYYENHLIELLTAAGVKDAESWIGKANALIDEKEMTEIRRSLFLRRKKLRNRIEYNMGALDKLKKAAEGSLGILDDEDREQITGIMKRIDEINKSKSGDYGL